ncbi:hypothetical protein GCM10023329_16570 [Streptomyces sanyensis]|uniref:Uncharacterized protein n=1 Tax=Streptomyces sanyensis TaxID=568869 RepID=A0ABP9A046_9ACTN
MAAAHPRRVSALALLCSAAPDHLPGTALRSVIEQEALLTENGDLPGAVELNVRTWLGPEAGDDIRELVRAMQRIAFGMQCAVPEDSVFQVEEEVALGQVEAPCPAVPGAHDMADFREIAARLPGQVCRMRSMRNCPGQGTGTSPENGPETRKSPGTPWCSGALPNNSSAASYSPTGSPLQYHRR